MSSMLEINGLCASYGAGDVLRDVAMRVPAGEIGCLLGANGAGKSTTMRSLSGLLRPVRGSICFEGEAIESLPTDAIVARGIVLVRSEEHTSEIQSLMRISYAVFCLQKKK